LEKVLALMWVLEQEIKCNMRTIYATIYISINERYNIPFVGETVGFRFGLRVNVGETDGMMLKK
jgi:hypothetical protein